LLCRHFVAPRNDMNENMTKIKICGIKTLEDALTAIDAGADYLGFNFYSKSVRFVERQACAAITSVLKKDYLHVTLVGVFVNSSIEEVKDVLDACSLDLAQLHGDETIEFMESLQEKSFKAFRGIPDDVNSFARTNAPAFLVDASVKGLYGGSGVTADWNGAAELAKKYPLLLAGGLTPENVAEAVRRVKPWGVDVSSGVESRPGVKDEAKIRAFVKAVREVESDRIQIAGEENLNEILSLQKLAYQSEAELNNDFDIPPLTQTLEEIRAEFGQALFLKAMEGERIIGSVRAHEKDGTCHVGRLIVHPNFQNRGIGSRLLKAIEAKFNCKRFELFTSERSERNLYLYKKFGYREFKRMALNEKTTLVFLEKFNDNFIAS